MNPVAKARVEAGAKFLDEKHPGWENKINLETLAMNSSWRCILGQLYGSFAYGVKGLGLTGLAQETALGFNLVMEAMEALPTFKDLAQAWTALILKRREASHEPRS